MRVVVTEHFRPADARGAVSIDERLRVNLEMGARRGMNIGGRNDAAYAITDTKQDAAAFAGMFSPRVFDDAIHRNLA